MVTAAIELCDSALALASGGELAAAGPGHAALIDGRLVFGSEARAVLRLKPRAVHRSFWHSLAEAPLAVPLGTALTTADLVQAQLASLWQARGAADAAVLAVPAGWSTEQLGLLLGIAEGVGMPVAGLVDGAVAASRRPYPGRALWHLVAGLQATWLSRIEQSSGATLGFRHGVERFGIETLERGATEFIARRFVECSRFDPLHNARSEQLVTDRLDGWLALAARQDLVPLELEHGGHRYEATLEAAALREAMTRLCVPLTQRLRTLVSPREASVLQVHHRLAEFPGVIEALLTLPGCAVVLLEPGAGARGALRLRAAPAASHTLTTSLGFDQPALAAAALPQAAAGRPPTHLVWGSRAWRLGDRALQAGTESADGAYNLALTGNAVSRRHFTIAREDGQFVLHDQSRYGTLLNGHAVTGAAVLQAGDVISVGQPPLVLTLVAEAGDAP